MQTPCNPTLRVRQSERPGVSSLGFLFTFLGKSVSKVNSSSARWQAVRRPACVCSLTFTSADAETDTVGPSRCPVLPRHFRTPLMALGPGYGSQSRAPTLLWPCSSCLQNLETAGPIPAVPEVWGPGRCSLSARRRGRMPSGLRPPWESCTSTSLGPVIWGTLLSPAAPSI